MAELLDIVEGGGEFGDRVEALKTIRRSLMEKTENYLTFRDSGGLKNVLEGSMPQAWKARFFAVLAEKYQQITREFLLKEEGGRDLLSDSYSNMRTEEEKGEDDDEDLKEQLQELHRRLCSGVCNPEFRVYDPVDGSYDRLPMFITIDVALNRIAVVVQPLEDEESGEVFMYVRRYVRRTRIWERAKVGLMKAGDFAVQCWATGKFWYLSVEDRNSLLEGTMCLIAPYGLGRRTNGYICLRSGRMVWGRNPVEASDKLVINGNACKSLCFD